MVAFLYIRQKNPEKAVACLREAPAPAFFFQIPAANPTTLFVWNKHLQDLQVSQSTE
jgi:Na+/serine symporter